MTSTHVFEMSVDISTPLDKFDKAWVCFNRIVQYQKEFWCWSRMDQENEKLQPCVALRQLVELHTRHAAGGNARGPSRPTKQQTQNKLR